MRACLQHVEQKLFSQHFSENDTFKSKVENQKCDSKPEMPYIITWNLDSTKTLRQK